MDRITKRLARKGTLGRVKICDETYTIRKSRIFRIECRSFYLLRRYGQKEC